MLYRFILQNFRSFRDRVELSLIPDENSEHIGFKGSQFPVLKDAIIYGPNASGKSNLIKALNFMRRLVLDEHVLLSGNNQSFRLSSEMVGSPTLFLTEIRIGESLYQYAILLSFKESRILEENLKVYDGKSKLWDSIFSRKFVEGKYKVNITIPNDSSLLETYKLYKEELSISPSRLLLSLFASKQLSGDSFIDSINLVYDWFERMTVIFPDTEYNLIGAVGNDMDAVNSLFKRYFNLFGIEIDNIKLTEVPAELLRIPATLTSSIKSDLIKMDSLDSNAILYANHQNYLVSLDGEGNLNFKEVRFVHKKDAYTAEFQMVDESDGTRRLFDLIPLIGYLSEDNRVAVIDEVDRSLHCLLTRKLIQTILEENANNNSQIIVSTHDVLLMDSHILGRKEVWFVSRQDMVSTLYPLDQFKYDDKVADVVKNYLIGRFKAIPEY